MITVKEYAKQKGVSHQAVYKQLQTHAEELDPHIVMNGRTRFLTDEAISILEKYRETNPQIIERTNDKELVEELENQIKLLLTRENELERKIAELSIELKDAYKKDADNAKAIAEANQKQLLLEEKTKEIGILEGFIKDAKKELDQQQQEARERERKLQEHYNEEVKKLNEELSLERNKSWLKKLFGR